jgi:L,D-transpeptidase ErfK/SrfK
MPNFKPLRLTTMILGIWMATAYPTQISKHTTYTTHTDQTLQSIGHDKHLGLDALCLANPLLNPYIPLPKGTTIALPTSSLIPLTPQPLPSIVVNLPEKRLYLLKEPESAFVASVGRPGWSTPTGTYQIIEKKEKPVWLVPAMIRQEQAQLGKPLPKVIQPGKTNPLGQYMLRLSSPSYLIHGTNDELETTIGQEQTAGCISLYPQDIAEIFHRTNIHDKVKIVNQPVKVARCQSDWCLEVYPEYTTVINDRNVTGQSYQETDHQRNQAILTYLSLLKAADINKELIQKMLKEKTGIPHIIAHQQH